MKPETTPIAEDAAADEQAVGAADAISSAEDTLNSTEDTLNEAVPARTAEAVAPPRRARTLTYFFLRAIAAVVVVTALWMPVADYLSRPASYLAGMALESSVFLVKGFTIGPKHFTLNTHIRVKRLGEIHSSGKQIIHVTPVSVSTNPLYYCYGLPLLYGLLLAASRRKLLKKILLGGIILIPFQAFGIAMSVLVQLVANPSRAVVDEMAFSYLQTMGVAYGFQLNNGFIPTLSAILLWLWMERGYVKETLLRK